jgi:PAS domain S-box-containing protein
MLRFTPLSHDSLVLSIVARYAIGIGSVIAAGATAFVLQNHRVRDPFALIFLFAVWVSVWCGGAGPGIAAVTLSLIDLSVLLHSPRGLFHISISDVPVFVIFLSTGLWIVWFGHARDLARRSSEEARDHLETEVTARAADLRLLRAEHQAVLDAAPFGVVTFAAERIVVRCNTTYERMLGAAPGELIGQSAPLPETERETWRRQEQELRLGNAIENYETLRVRMDGAEFPATITIAPLIDAIGGDYKGIVGVITDDTEREYVDARLQMLCAVVQNSPDLITVTDMNMRGVFLNRTGQEMLGLSDEDAATLTQSLDYFAEDPQREISEELLPLLLERGRLARELSVRNFRSGKTFPALWTAFVIHDRKTRQPALLGAVVRDSTERYEHRDALRRSLEDNEVLRQENRALQEQLQREDVSLQELNPGLDDESPGVEPGKFEKIIGVSPELRRTLVLVNQVASTDATVLITGETGTGKELIAQAIHENSKRARRPFRSINCAALPPALMAAELFGHEKGAFTGADRHRAGQFELAAGGTLFLDEIAEIPIEMQATLLRVLEEYTFDRLGGTGPVPVDVRIIAATNRDLHAAMKAGEFRPDLFYRLSAFSIEMPPLRERREDIPMLVTHFISRSSVRHGKVIRAIEKKGMDLLRSYDWPGNIRELRNVIDTSMIRSVGETLLIDERLLFGTRPADDEPIGSLQKQMTDHERILIERALAESRGQISGTAGAAMILHLPPSTLTARIKTLRIDTTRFKSR